MAMDIKTKNESRRMSSQLRWPQMPDWLVATVVIAVLCIGAFAVFRGGSLKISGGGAGAEIVGHGVETLASAHAVKDEFAARTAIAELGRVAATLEPRLQTTNPYGGTLRMIPDGAELKATYECGDEAPCPEGTNGQATGALLSPFAVVQRPTQLELLKLPGVHQLLLLDAIVLDHAQRTLAEQESILTSPEPQDVKLLFDSAREACNLDPAEVDSTIRRLTRLRGLEANAGFWIGDPGQPAPAARFHLDDNPTRVGSHSKFPQFGHYLIMIEMASGLTYAQDDQIQVSSLTALVGKEYWRAFEAVGRFTDKCRKILSKS